ncbi:MAG: hypothetical protein ACI8TQ_002368 [Planctomycetota bacterium]|jgi:hypothetical protein
MNIAHSKSSSRASKARGLTLLFGSIAFAALLTVSSCSSTFPNREVLGERFPEVTGETLTGEKLALPLNEPTVLLLGYVQDAQFDADRWLIGLLQATPPVRILEVPTIPGLFPTMLAGTIDEGMRKGIPSEDWQSVATVYGSDAELIVELTGNERPRNIRVLLLDAEGRVRWFHDRGFSAGKLLELGKEAARLVEASSK